MQLNFRLWSVLGLVLFTTITSCKKDDQSATDNTTEITTHSEDQSRVSGDMDEITNDVNIALEADGSFSGRQQNIQSICGASAVADTMSNPWKITITYNGPNCLGTQTRVGTVILSMPAATRWKNPGATLTVTYQNLKITRVADNKSITINGSHTLTNVSGGLLFQLPNLTSITHTIASSNMSITFDDNTQRIWQVARKRVYTYANGVVLTITGDHTDGNNTGIAEWGTNRFGHAFTTSITQPLVIRQDCAFRLTSGQITHQGFGTATATFGLDASGNATSCPGTGHYYYKLTWTGAGGNTHTLLFPY
jgi:hypothetical protein